ncbi:MAG TPA: BTAD domain-containing putative transcriptional regulator, partial [Acidimicrobiales bacterium]|nr:BTAD domain-containing putative transcriptional regulator [Acidimicrobiales bacterium]
MRVRLFGTLEVVADDGTVVPVNGAKLRMLLALLALDAGKVVAADRLIDCLYGDHLPQRADNALQLLVSKLRQALTAGAPHGPAIVTRAPGYFLDVPAEEVDARRFLTLVAEGRARLEAGDYAEASSALREALGLWRGPALVEFAFDDFARSEIARLDELRLSASEDCFAADLELGRHLDVVGELAQFTAANPLRERPWGQFMQALYRSGRQADALRAFQEARAHLAEELGIDPGPELRRLEAAILAQDPSLAGAAAEGNGHAEQPGRVGNVGAPLSQCLGRDDELAAVRGLLDGHRLVTLVGPGGVGKTRLAVEVALSEAARCPGGVWLVELAPVSEDGVVPALRTVLGGPVEAGTSATLAAALGSQELLVVLDNCEHVVEAAARAAVDLVTAAPQVRVMATSRETLGVPGEVLFNVPPLKRDAAVRLFAERAAAAAPGIRFDEPDTVAVGDICDRLDGLPLAIELAASRARALEVTQIATRLSDRFRLLSGGSRTALPRQQTLRAVVDWSYDLLADDERLVFERL